MGNEIEIVDKVPASAAEAGSGMEIAIIDSVIKVIDHALVAYRDVQVAREVQATERERIRKQAEVEIARIEAEVHMFEMNTQSSHECRIKIIDSMTELLKCEKIDPTILELCEKMLDKLPTL